MENSSTFQTQAKNLGTIIRNSRINSNKSLESCAKAMGIDPQEYEAYEQGEQAPSLPEIEALGYYLEISID